MRRILPLSDPANIDMHEPVLGIVAHASIVQSQRGVAQGKRRDAGNANVDGVSQNVHTMLGNAAGGVVQKRVRPRRAVSADDVDRSSRVADGLVEMIEQIEKTRVHIVILMNAPVPKKTIQSRFGGRQVMVALTVDDVEAPARVQVVEGETETFGRRRLRYGWENREEREEYSETAAADPMGKSLATHGSSLL